MNYFLLSALKAAVVLAALLTTLAYLQWVERKVIAHIQLRIGPYRVGPHGLFQPLADVIKLFTKEDIIPAHVNKFFYLLAPFLAITLSLISISIIPFGPNIEVFGIATPLQLADLTGSISRNTASPLETEGLVASSCVLPVSSTSFMASKAGS